MDSNCKNCAAPLDWAFHKCRYCGTMFRAKEASNYANQTAAGAMIEHDNLLIAVRPDYQGRMSDLVAQVGDKTFYARQAMIQFAPRKRDSFINGLLSSSLGFIR